MIFRENRLYHIYNIGNRKQQVFFSPENYQYFLWKMRGYLLPFGDLVAWCLMSNHFHWLFFVKRNQIKRKELWASVDDTEYRRRVAKYGDKAESVNKDWSRKASGHRLISFNDSIGNLQKAYAKALNIQQNNIGGLFRKPFQANSDWVNEFVTLKRKGGSNYLFQFGNDFPYNCFNYIHQNPVEAGIVERATDYPWSSAKDYAGKRKGDICNLELGREILKYV